MYICLPELRILSFWNYKQMLFTHIIQVAKKIFIGNIKINLCERLTSFAEFYFRYQLFSDLVQHSMHKISKHS